MTSNESIAPICLILRGGLGNQLLQLAYVHHITNLSKRKHRLYYSQLLFDGLWSIIRQNTVRRVLSSVPLAAGFTQYNPSMKSVFRNLPRLTSLRLLTESGTALDHLAAIDTLRILPIFLGYFHRSECFSPFTKSFWLHIYEVLRLSHPATPFRTNKIAIHIRLGDYLNKKNSKIYSLISVNDQVTRCLSHPQCDITDAKVDIFTDEPEFIAHQLYKHYRPFVNIRSTKDPIEDLMTLASYQQIWASNSTFSLCAGRISSLIHNKQTLVLPPRWFVSDSMNNIEMNKWRILDFVLPL